MLSGRMKLLNELQDLLADSLKDDVTYDVMAESTLQVNSLHTCTCVLRLDKKNTAI